VTDNANPHDLIALLRTFIGDTQIVRAARAAADMLEELSTCKLCRSTGHDTPCAYPTEINRQQAKRIAELEARSDLLKFIPTSADQMIEFIGPHFNSVSPVGDDGKLTGDLESVTFSLTVHDLLSAFEWSNLGPDEVAAVAGAQPECQACGDSITTHDPGICGNCFAMKYRDSSVAKDAEVWRSLLSMLIREIQQRYRRDDNPNAPGHGHLRPGIWDNDNGSLSGTQCAWCAIWKEAKASLAASEPKNTGN
jgi:hypothetical protein